MARRVSGFEKGKPPGNILNHHCIARFLDEIITIQNNKNFVKTVYLFQKITKLNVFVVKFVEMFT